MILEILYIIIGLIVGLFLPGYILTLVLFRELNQIEKIALAIGLSICIDITVGLFLGANKTMALITGGITEFNLWGVLLIIIGIFLLIFLFSNPPKNYKEKLVNIFNNTFWNKLKEKK